MAPWQSALERWRSAGLIDEATAARVRAWESAHGAEQGRSRLVAIIFALGGLLLAAGVLLFVAAHWDEISPGMRFGLVLAMVGLLHVAAASASRSYPGLATTLHAVGTATMGAGVFLAGQIFNLAEHWPGGLLLWALGAAAGLALLRDWPHVLWVAVLAPAWLWGEWIEAHPRHAPSIDSLPALGIFLLAVSYLMAETREAGPLWRRALSRLGAGALIPAAIFLGVTGIESDSALPQGSRSGSSAWLTPIAWLLAAGLPALLAVALRGRRAAIRLLAALVWAALLLQIGGSSDGADLLRHALYAAGSIGIVFLGLEDEERLHVNVGVLGFALAIAAFYFSSIFDKLGRSLGLIGMGVIFIGGGWLLERARRRLLEHVGRSAA